jgi:hypothetical protein
MIAQDFEFTGDFPIERNTQVYWSIEETTCGFKRLARARRLMGFPGSRLISISARMTTRRPLGTLGGYRLTYSVN